ncbi:iron ABC transporter permease [Clostridia bacterium]|nr:iron ABC transporter permease [Clostridia bacterium]
MIRKKPYIVFMISCFFLLFLVILSLGTGRYSLSLKQIFFFSSLDETAKTVLFHIRLPRILATVLCGAGLALSGVIFQALFSNPLATGDTLGVATGASFGAVLAIFFGLSLFWIQLFSLGFGILALLAVAVLSRNNESDTLLMMIFSGMVVSAFFSALVSLMKYVADPQNVLPAITFWLLGSLSGIQMREVFLTLPFFLSSFLILFVLRWRLNVLVLQDEEAKSLGSPIVVLRVIFLLCASMLVGATVSLCGLIGWVGLLVPHALRKQFGADHRHLVPLSMSFGAIFLLLTDTLARSLLPSEVPISILTALIGAPLFFYLVRKNL